MSEDNFDMLSKNTAIKCCRFAARILLLVVTTFCFIFALLSGSNEYGGGLRGIIRNSPNAIPWILLYVINVIAWKWELIGGIIVIAIGVFFFFFFNILKGNLTVLYFTVIPLIIIGGLFIFSWVKSRPKDIVNKSSLKH